MNEYSSFIGVDINAHALAMWGYEWQKNTESTESMPYGYMPGWANIAYVTWLFDFYKANED